MARNREAAVRTSVARTLGWPKARVWVSIQHNHANVFLHGVITNETPETIGRVMLLLSTLLKRGACLWIPRRHRLDATEPTSWDYWQGHAWTL